MKKINYFWILGVISLLLLSSFVWNRGKKVRNNPELRKEARAYFQENILPVLKKQREKLESQLTEEEKKEIEKLRNEMLGNREERKAMKEKMHKAMDNSDALSIQEKAEMFDLFLKGRAKKEELHEVLKKYDDRVLPLLEEIAPQKEKWKEDMKKIAEKHIGKEGVEEMKSHHHFKHHFDRKTSKIAFILADFEKDEKIDKAIKIFPNPANQKATVEYSLQEPDNVEISLSDKEGNILKKLWEGKKDKGDHQLEFDVQSLSKGQYFVIIKSSKKLERKRLVIE
ncbi:MAG: hypothetical protein OHK0038_25790 [Flammeovirgaceae bacterium]